MPAPNGYDIGLQHSAVNGGTAVGFLLDEADRVGAGLAPAPFVEEQAIVAHVDVTTAGVASVASYGLGAVTYRCRLQLATDVLKRDRRPGTETPATLRTRLLEFAAKTDGLVMLQLAVGNRRVAFTEAVKFISGPGIDGYVALVALVDLGAG